MRSPYTCHQVCHFRRVLDTPHSCHWCDSSVKGNGAALLAASPPPALCCITLKPREPQQGPPARRPAYLSYHKGNIAHDEKGQGTFQLGLRAAGDAAPPPPEDLHSRKQPDASLSETPSRPGGGEAALQPGIPGVCLIQHSWPAECHWQLQGLDPEALFN